METLIVARRPHIRVTIPPPRWKPASTHLLKNSHNYHKLCVPLCDAATRGNWSAAKKIMRKDDSIIHAAITKESHHTVLHIAASRGHYDFMKKLLKLLREDDLHLLDRKGNAAFCLAVAAGKVHVAKIMLQKDPLMAELKCAEGMSQLRLATYHGHGKMAWFLYPKIIKGLEQEERVATFFNCTNSTDTALHELALKMLLEYTELAEARDTNGATAFHVLAKNPSAFTSALLKRFLYPGLGKQLKTPGLQILKQLWKIVSEKDEKTVKGILTMHVNGKPSNALFIAAEYGNVQFLAELFASDPALKFEKDECNRSVFHIGAMYHQRSIFSLVDKLGPDEYYSILSAVDNEGNTILHLAAKVAKLQWDEMVGPEVQMKRDLKGFKEVRKVVPPGCLDMRNTEGKTPGDIFSEQHGALNALLVNKKEMSWTTLVTIIASYFGIGGASFGVATFVLQQIRGK